MPANTPIPQHPRRILRCDACGRSFDCTAGEVVRYVQGEWPECCGFAMRYYVETEIPTPMGMRRPPPKKSK